MHDTTAVRRMTGPNVAGEPSIEPWGTSLSLRRSSIHSGNRTPLKNIVNPAFSSLIAWVLNRLGEGERRKRAGEKKTCASRSLIRKTPNALPKVWTCVRNDRAKMRLYTTQALAADFILILVFWVHDLWCFGTKSANIHACFRPNYTHRLCEVTHLELFK